MNLISIIEDWEKQALEQSETYKIEMPYFDSIKSHNRATLLKLVEGIEEWANNNKVRCEECENGEIHDTDPVNKKLDDLISLLTELKDKLKR